MLRRSPLHPVILNLLLPLVAPHRFLVCLRIPKDSLRITPPALRITL